MALLRIKLLGKPQLYLADQPLTGFTTAKTEALFYYLAATARPHARETLADLLWGEMPEEKARRSLAKALSDLRKVVAPYLVIDRQMAAIDLTADYELDMAHFQALVERGLAESERVDQRRVSLEEAAVLYEGEFLESFSLRQTLTFDAWLRAQREKLHELMLAGLDALIDIYVHQADLDKSRGVDYAGRLLALDPQRESAHRQMMVLLAQTDQRTAALAQYETCRAILAKALGVEPTAEMSALYERLKETDAPLPHNLPKQSSLFVGREAELQQVAELLSLPDCHLLTIVGPGGIGKTRLALEAAMRYVRLGFQPDKTGFQDGIYFVDLTPILTGRVDPDRLANTLASTIAEALGISFHGPDDLLAQLLHYLRDKQMLLLLDNFDPLVEGAGMLAELIRQAPQTRLLVTSRERLNLLEEWVVEIQGLTYPGDKVEAELLTADPIDIEALLAYSAVALFGQLAQHIQHEFRLTAATAPEVIRICRLVEGVPLALELAASWLRVIDSTEIAVEISNSLDFLTTSLRNIPERHRSLRAVFEQSWRMLADEEQEAYEHLAVFRGGFQREAAHTVAGASLPVLAGLVDKSLLRLSPGGRYETHEMLRQFAAEKLARNPGVATATRDAHARYYARFLKNHERQIMSHQGITRLTNISLEIANFRAAWGWIVDPSHPIIYSQLSRSIWGLRYLYARRGWTQEALSIFGQAAQRLEAELDQTAVDPEHHLAYGQVLLSLGVFNQYLGELAQADHYFRRGQAEIEQSNLNLPLATREIGLSLHLQAIVHWQRGAYAEAEALLVEGLRYFRVVDDPILIARSLTFPGIVAYAHGDYRRAQELLNEGVLAFQPLDEFWYTAEANGCLAQVNWTLGESLAEQRAALVDCLARVREVGNTPAVAHALQYLGATLRLSRGEDLQAARKMLEESVSLYRTINMAWGMVPALHQLALVQIDLGDDPAAEVTYHQALELSRSSQLTPTVLAVLLGLAQLLMRYKDLSAERLERLATLLTLALNHPGSSQQVRDQAAQLLRQLAAADLSPAIVAAARERGQSITIDAMVEEILHDLQTAETTPIG